jgi:hypothetical protein
LIHTIVFEGFIIFLLSTIEKYDVEKETRQILRHKRLYACFLFFFSKGDANQRFDRYQASEKCHKDSFFLAYKKQLTTVIKLFVSKKIESVE